MSQTDSHLTALIEQNRELNERFESAVANFWKVINDERAEGRAQQVQRENTGNDEPPSCIRNAVSDTGKALSVGKTFTVFTDMPEPVGTEFNVIDKHGNVMNVACVTHVELSGPIWVRKGKYALQAKVLQELSPVDDEPFAAYVFWTQ